MEIRQLRYYIFAAKTLNFTEAARLSNISQSTLSQQIKQLETDLGVSLFERIGKRILLSEAGRSFLPFAEKTVADAENGAQMLRDMENLKTGKLRIGVTYGLSPVLAQTLKRFCSLYTEMTVEVIYRKAAELLELLHSGDLDFALSFNLLEPDDRIEEQHLFTTHLCVVVEENHPLASCIQINPAVLANYPIVIPSKGVNARHQFDSFIRSQKLHITPQIEINEIYTLLHLVKTGQWITVLTKALVHEQDGLVAIPFAKNNIPMNATLLLLKDAYQRNAVKAFIGILREEAETGKSS